jgi:hypothetical protein
MRDNAKRHARSVYWAVFDQKGRLLEGDFGPGRALIPVPQLEKLASEVIESQSVQSVLEVLRNGSSDKAAKLWQWAQEAAPAASTTTYTLIVPVGEGEEFESQLELTQEGPRLSGVLTGADGAQTEIENATLEGRRLQFQVVFGDARFSFDGQVAKDIVRGTLS